MSNINKLIKLIDDGDPNTIVDDENIFIRLIRSMHGFRLGMHKSRLGVYGFRWDMQQMLDRGANPNSRNRYGRYAIEICAREDEMILMRYGATKYNCDEEYRVARRINRVLIICDMMLYIDDGVPSDWIREIKGCLY